MRLNQKDKFILLYFMYLYDNIRLDFYNYLVFFIRFFRYLVATW